MTDRETYLKNLTGKDEKAATDAAKYLIENSDKELFKVLADKSDFLFDFVINNVCKRISGVITSGNFKNVINFFDIYSPYYDDLFADILSVNANEELTDEIFELLENGTVAQKTYAAKYFSYIPDTVALELLTKYAFTDDEYLSCNAAEALGQMCDDTSYDTALNYLASDDDFDKLKAVKYFTAYGDNYPLKQIFNAIKTSKIPENIAGQIPYTVSLLSLLHTEYKKDALFAFAYIINGIGEILPLSDIFRFEIYEVLDKLIKSKSDDILSSIIILNANSKFSLFVDNPEYMYDEDKNTKNEVLSVRNLLNSLNKEYIGQLKKNLTEKLSESGNMLHLAMDTICEYKIIEAVPVIKELLNSDKETVICEALMTLKQLNEISGTDLKEISERIQNPHIKALIESLDE